MDAFRIRSSPAFVVCMFFATAVAIWSTPSGIGEVTLFGEEEFKIQAATKTELPISKAPSSVTVISAQQIRESGARTIPELLRLVAGVNVRWNPMVQTIDIRGFGQNPFTNRVLLLIDGVPTTPGTRAAFPSTRGSTSSSCRGSNASRSCAGPAPRCTARTPTGG